jgi:hypothetical protein
MTQPASKRLLTEANAAAQASNSATPLGAALSATYALKSEVGTQNLDGGNATSNYSGTFNFDGGSAA